MGMSQSPYPGEETEKTWRSPMNLFGTSLHHSSSVAPPGPDLFSPLKRKALVFQMEESVSPSVSKMLSLMPPLLRSVHHLGATTRRLLACTCQSLSGADLSRRSLSSQTSLVWTVPYLSSQCYGNQCKSPSTDF